jgi:class 3 adenylate cyclase
MYADMVGYSRLIGLDDQGTLQRLRKLRSEVIDPAIREHGGRIVQTGGDSLLIVFDSIDGAVRCAVQVQQQVPIHDGDQLADRAIRFRMGINLGDAIADGTDLHGDAVNVVARLQAECPPGAICVSRSVRDHVHGRLDLAFEELGPLNLKNINRPVEAFVLRLGTAASAPKSVRDLQGDHEVRHLPDKPSIAVLAFTNMSGDPDQEYFSDGISDDIITELSRTRWLFVIARNSTFTYKGRAVDVKRVAHELSVRYVLEVACAVAEKGCALPFSLSTRRQVFMFGPTGMTARSRMSLPCRTRSPARLRMRSSRQYHMRNDNEQFGNRRVTWTPGRLISVGCGIWRGTALPTQCGRMSSSGARLNLTRCSLPLMPCLLSASCIK